MNNLNKLLSDIVSFRTYSKYIPHLNRRESLEENINRNMSMHLDRFPKLSKDIIKAYQKVHELKVMPSMRAMQFSGDAILKNNLRQYNCSYCSIDNTKVFGEILYILLSGTGVGFSVQKQHITNLPKIKQPKEEVIYKVHDSIMGWAMALETLTDSYFYGKVRPIFDLSLIRPKNSYMVTTGAKAPGPIPLKNMLEVVELKLKQAIGRRLSSLECHDIICIISDCVLAGGIRRSALISLFDKDDKDMLTCKQGEWWNKHPYRARANNSAILIRSETTKEEFDYVFDMCKESNAGEPGFFFSNSKELGTNPCCEISLNSNQFCNLSTINQTGIESKKDFLNRVYAATLIGTLQASYTEFDYLRPVWQETTEREALLGVSFTGIADANNAVTKELLLEGSKLLLDVNEKYAKKIGINLSARNGCVKPEGCRPWDGLVTTESGIFTLQELFKDHKYGEKFSVFSDNLIISHNSNNKIIHTYDNGISEVISINLNGGISLESTKNHMWSVLTKRGPEFIRAEDIKAGDQIDLKIGSYTKEGHSKLEGLNLFQHNMSKLRFQDIHFPTEMSEDLAWLLGYIWADGSVTSKNRIKFFEQDIEITKHIKVIIKKLFNLDLVFTKCKNKDMYEGSIGSVELVSWLHKNKIEKYAEDSVNLIPLCVRTSDYKDIIAFIAGFSDGDGCIRKDTRSKTRSYLQLTLTQKASVFTKHIQDIALSVGLVFGRSLNSRRNSYGTNPIHLMHLSGQTLKKSAEILKNAMIKCRTLDKPLINETVVVYKTKLGIVQNTHSIGILPTFDVEVENNPWFYAGAVKSHNSASCVLMSSSGIHARHSEFYTRRIRMNKDDALAMYLKSVIPDLVEDDLFSSTGVVVSIPQSSPEGAITRHSESALTLMERGLFYHENWIKPSHRYGNNTHNVSITISVRDNEWESLKQRMWDERYNYSGISLLPFNDSVYQQAPFEDISKEKYQEMSKLVGEIDLRNVSEETDNTVRSELVACSGGVCEIV